MWFNACGGAMLVLVFHTRNEHVVLASFAIKLALIMIDSAIVNT